MAWKISYRFMRHPHTLQEKRANQENGRKPGWARPARRWRNLPDTYDDIFIRQTRCWKDDPGRDKQYYPVRK
jgi:hypothetical protein